MREAAWHPIIILATALIAMSAGALAFGLQLPRVTEIAIYALYGAGLNLLIGYTGLVPFGASVFFGVAGYATALVARTTALGEPAAIVLAAVMVLVLAGLLGLLTLRRRGLYFSLLTLAFSQIAFEIALKWTSVTGGENGLQGVDRVLFVRPVTFHFFCLAVVVGCMWLLWRLAHSPFGRVLQAIRENEPRAQSLGYDTFGIKLVAFVLSAVVIGIAGSLLALMLQGVYADNLSWQHSGDALLTTVLGGVHHFLGPLWGAAVFILLQDNLSALTENWWLLFGPILVAIVLVAPDGLQGLAQRMVGRPRRTLVRHSTPPRPARIEALQTSSQVGPGAPVLEVRGLSKRFGAIVAADQLSFSVDRAGLHSIIGPNGAGKTTLFNLLTGTLRPSSGEIRLNGQDVRQLSVHRRARLGLGRSFQIVRGFPHLSAFENVRISVQARSPLRFGFWRDATSYDAMNRRTWTMLAAVGLAERADIACGDLAHGEQRLLEIAVCLATDAALLLLDEPLAGLAEADRVTVSRLIRSLADRRAVLLIEHDIDRVLGFSDRLTVLDRGRIIADGDPRQVVAEPDVVSAYLGQRPMGGHADASPSVSARMGATLLSIESLSAGYAGSRILDGLNMVVREGEIVAILGRNGVGKTTTLRAITGLCQKQAGRIAFDGADVTNLPTHAINRLGIAIVPQGRRLFPNLTVTENLRIAQRSGGGAIEEVFALFPKLQRLHRSRAENLSGGERQMVAMGRALMAPSRLILLDEPFEGLAPAIVDDIMEALLRLRTRASLVIVEHDISTVLTIAERAYVLVNGKVAVEAAAADLARDHAAQAKHLGVAYDDHALQPT